MMLFSGLGYLLNTPPERIKREEEKTIKQHNHISNDFILSFIIKQKFTQLCQ